MLCLFLILACGPSDYMAAPGIEVENAGDGVHVTISPATLTATLYDRLSLNAGQMRIISRIVMEAGAEIEEANCSSKSHEKEIHTLIRQMDRGIRKQLSPRQRARYEALKKERRKAMIVRRAKAEQVTPL